MRVGLPSMPILPSGTPRARSRLSGRDFPAEDRLPLLAIGLRRDLRRPVTSAELPPDGLPRDAGHGPDRARIGMRATELGRDPVRCLQALAALLVVRHGRPPRPLPFGVYPS